MLIMPFCVLAGGEGEITWQKDGKEIVDENVKKIDESSSKLIITQATMADAGVYSCHCEFESKHTDQITTQLYIFGMSTLNTELQFVVISQHPKLLLFCQTDPRLAPPRATMSSWRAERAWCLAWLPVSQQWMLSG